MKYKYYQQPATHKTEANQWRWRLVSSNGKILASGEAYHNKQDMLDAIDRLKETDKNTPTEKVDAPA